MEWRRPKEEDLDLFLRVHPETLGIQAVPSGKVPQIWRRLLTAAGFQGAVVTRSKPPASDSITAVGAGVFVDESFVENELHNPVLG